MRKVALVVLIVLLGGLGIEVAARAYRVGQCNRFAKVVRGIAQERDRGVSSDAMRARLKATEAASAKHIWTPPACKGRSADAMWNSVAVIYPACLSGVR
jgi:hypothetical protein